MSKIILICESPGKVKKLQEYAGSNYTVIPSYGHIRELAKTGTQGLGFSLDTQKKRVFCNYITHNSNSKKVLNKLLDAIKNSNQVVLATDEDREGEFISWHLWDALSLKSKGIKVVRVTFNEITQKAVQNALANPRQIDMDLVNAAKARSCLDKLVGFSLSPLLWQTGTGAKSAGRCQSAALHLLAERERAIQNFQPEDYWLVRSHYAENLVGVLHFNGKDFRFSSEEEAQKVVDATSKVPHKILNIETKEESKSPPAPFTTSTLQQVAGNKLNFNTKTTMSLAQKLYESGLITYMRTDSCTLSEDFRSAAKGYLQQHDPENIPEKPTQHRNKSSAQEGHEAIRPTDVENTPDVLRSKMEGQELKLYELIWNRALASQCKPALMEHSLVKIAAGEWQFLLKGNRILQESYAKYWEDLGEESLLPELSIGQELDLEKVRWSNHQTEPPKRFTEPSLVKVLEQTGIGRPSTYANIISTLLERIYVTLNNKNLVVTELGLKVDDFLFKVVRDIVSPGFTAQMETNLDEIAAGQLDWEQWLVNWDIEVFQPALTKGKSASEQIVSEQLTHYPCPVCGARLEKHQYIKNRELKTMLRCSESRNLNCQEVTYFQSKGVFWSPKFGELTGQESPETSALKTSRKTSNKPTSKLRKKDHVI